MHSITTPRKYKEDKIVGDIISRKLRRGKCVLFTITFIDVMWYTLRLGIIDKKDLHLPYVKYKFTEQEINLGFKTRYLLIEKKYEK